MSGKFYGIVAALCLLAVPQGYACAQSFEVRVRQLNPDGPVSEALCDAGGGQACFLTVEIDPLTESGGSKAQKFLDVGMRFSQDQANVNFMWGREYVFAGTYEQRERGVDVALDEKGQGYKRVTLRARSMLQQTESETSIVLRPYNPVAEIEVGIRRVSAPAQDMNGN